MDIYISSPRDPGKVIQENRNNFLKDSLFKKAYNFWGCKKIGDLQEEYFQEVENEGLSNISISVKGIRLNRDFQAVATVVTEELKREEPAKKALCLLSPTFQECLLTSIYADLVKNHANWNESRIEIDPINLEILLSHTELVFEFREKFGILLCTIKGEVPCIKSLNGKKIEGYNLNFDIDLEKDTATFSYAQKNQNLDYEIALPLLPDSSLLENSKRGMSVLKNKEIENFKENPLEILKPLYPHAEINLYGRKGSDEFCEWKVLITHGGETGILTLSTHSFMYQKINSMTGEKEEIPYL